MGEPRTILRFASHLPDGFELLRDRTLNGQTVCQDFALFFKQRAILEEQYVKGLEKLIAESRKAGGCCSTKKGVHIELGTVQSAWNTLLVEAEKEAQQRKAVAAQIKKECTDSLLGHTKSSKETMNANIQEGGRQQTAMKRQLTVVVKKRDAAISTTKALNKSRAQQATVTPEQRPKVDALVASLTTKKQTQMEEYKTAYREYQNMHMEYYERKMPDLLNVMQGFEDDRIGVIKNVLANYANLTSTVIPVMQASSDHTNLSSRETDCHYDNDAFIRESAAVSTTHFDMPVFVNLDQPMTDEEIAAASRAVVKSGNRPAVASVSRVQEHDHNLDSTSSSNADPDEVDVGGLDVRRLSMAVTTVMKEPQVEDEGAGIVPGPPPGTPPSNEPPPIAHTPEPVPEMLHKAEQVIAVYDYTSDEPDDLHFKQGDIIHVYGKNADGWYHGELNGTRGLVPSNYVQPYEG